MTAVADVLNGAADLIERDGWCQHRYRSIEGGRCLTRALADALDLPLDGLARWRNDPLYLDAEEALRRITGRYLLTGFNDHPDRTEAEVVAALRAAAETASSQAKGGT